MAPMIAPPAEPPTVPVRVRCCVAVISPQPANPIRITAAAELRILRMACLRESAADAGGRCRAWPGRGGGAPQAVGRPRVGGLGGGPPPGGGSSAYLLGGWSRG